MPRRGPTTPRGKAVASRNATKHGILSDSAFVPNLEDRSRWNAHFRGTMDSLQPHGHLETVLAERVASLLWRLYRLQRYESEMVDVHIRRIPDDLALSLAYSKSLGKPEPGDDELQERYHDSISRRLVGSDDSMAKVMRYESHLHRLLLQTLHELEALQVRRQGGASPLARLDISGPPVA